MDMVTISADGQIAIPNRIRQALNLSEGTKLALDVRGNEIVLSKASGWRKLRGLGADPGLMEEFAAHRRAEREREDSGT